MVSTRLLLVVVTTPVPTLYRSCRYLRFSLHYCLLCTAGEGFEGARAQSPPGACHCVLWDCCHRRKRELIASPSRNSPGGAPYPLGSRYLAFFRTTIDRVHPFGGDASGVSSSASLQQGDGPVHDTPAPNHGRGHSSCTSPA